jgi:hypothetical protein
VSFLSQPLQTVFLKPARKIGTIAVQVVVDEVANDTLTVTRQPVQQGASITDHAYMEPTTFSHTIYFAAPGLNLGVPGFGPETSLNQVYQDLLALQSSAEPFTIVTPKRVYNNMLMTVLTQTTDKLTENCLAIRATYQQIIIVSVVAGTVPRINQRNAGSTGATQNGGQKQSALYTGSQAFGLVK